MDFDLSAGYVMASLVASSIGFALFKYGKSQGRAPQLISGIAMMLCPSVAHSPALILGACGTLLGALYLASKRY